MNNVSLLIPIGFIGFILLFVWLHSLGKKLAAKDKAVILNCAQKNGWEYWEEPSEPQTHYGLSGKGAGGIYWRYEYRYTSDASDGGTVSRKWSTRDIAMNDLTVWVLSRQGYQQMKSAVGAFGLGLAESFAKKMLKSAGVPAFAQALPQSRLLAEATPVPFASEVLNKRYAALSFDPALAKRLLSPRVEEKLLLFEKEQLQISLGNPDLHLDFEGGALDETSLTNFINVGLALAQSYLGK